MKRGQPRRPPAPFRFQLLKWIGNKQRFAHEIISYFPDSYGTYFEPFLGSGAVLGSLAPTSAIASDILKPLAEIWITLQNDPLALKQWYADRWRQFMSGNRQEVYERIKASYNRSANAADLIFLARACYGGVVRFRQADGYMSTPIGVHQPITPDSFNHRVDLWRERTSETTFLHSDFEPVMEQAQAGDVVYCDPPYVHSQAILYGAQTFSLERLFAAIARCKKRGVYVLLSIDGIKKSGQQQCRLPIPPGLFERQALVNCGRSMLRRFQMEGESLPQEVVHDRLLLTW
ncbi:MAG: DNA methyltransferase [Deltaproteobacteria bacterium RBG_13_61_14]|nr:MAG: DNA methyltransferase [Deltaproteobacteria bacterium RBG_13_61_14]